MNHTALVRICGSSVRGGGGGGVDGQDIGECI